MNRIMNWQLVRTYFPNGTNGTLWCGSQLICHTIELPWFNNAKNVSCIPEGKYELSKFYSIKFGSVIQVLNVQDRDAILIHPANDASKELRGCIAPVMVHTGIGRGLSSNTALQQMLRIANLSLERQGKLFLFINSKHDHYENKSESGSSSSKHFGQASSSDTELFQKAS